MDGDVMYFNGKVMEENLPEELYDALEIVRLLEEMGINGGELFFNYDNWLITVSTKDGYVRTISKHKTILQCLCDAKAKGWKP